MPRAGRPGGGGPGRRWSIIPRLDPLQIGRKWHKKAATKSRRNRLLKEDRADFLDIEVEKRKEASRDAELGVNLLPIADESDALASENSLTEAQKAEMRSELKKEESRICWWKPVLTMAVCEVVVTITSIARGGCSRAFLLRSIGGSAQHGFSARR